jgi:uncharacterized protein (TIGR03545 family)
MGSSILAFLLIVPMYFMLNSLVYIYRDKIASTLQKYTIFRTLGVSVSGKKDKFLRIWGFGLFVVLAGLVISFSLVFLDPLAKMLLEKSLSKATKKDVQIGSVNVSFKESSLNVKNLNIFKDGVSSVKASLIAADLDFNQILFKRYHIEDIAIKGLSFNQATDAQIKKETTSAQKQNESKSKSLDIDTPSLPSPQTLMDRAGLKSTKNYEDAQEKFDNVEKKYKNALENDFSKDELKSIKSRASKIQADLKSIKSIKNLKPNDIKLIKNSIDDIKNLRKEIKSKKQKLDKLKKDFNKDKNNLVNLSNTIVNGAKNDYENLSQNYQLNKQGGTNVVGVLFGNDIKTYMSTFLEYYEMAKPYLKSEEKPPAPQRGEGRWIKYKELNTQVDMLVKNVDINGVYNSNRFSANMKNISSNQKLLNKPFKFKLNTNGMLSKPMDLGLTKLNSANLSIKADASSMDYVSILADTKLRYKDAKFSSKGLSDLKEFYVDIQLSNKIISPKVKIKSDLDIKLKEIFSKVIKQKLLKYKKELKERIDAQMQEKLSKLGLKNKEIQKLNKVLNGSIDDFSDTDALLENYEDDLKKELKSGVKDKAKDELKDKAKDLLKSFKF